MLHKPGKKYPFHQRMSLEETKALQVLIVEDDPSMQSVLNQYLGSRFSVTILSDGIDAMSFLHAGNVPDIIIADLNTPQLGGLALIEQLKVSGFFKSVPIMILSGEESTEMRIKCLETGADDYVVKPFNPRELEVRLKVILRRTGKLPL